jgi:hypothetical protein
MSELTFGMRLTYDGKSAAAGLEETRVKLDGLTTSSGKLAAQNRMLGQSYKEHGAEVQNTEAGVRKLLDRYDPLGAKLRQLQNDFKQLNSAAAGGKIAAGDDARVDQVYANLQKQITATSAATNGYAVASTNAARSAGQLRMANQQLPMQFTDIWVSLAAGQNPMMVMLQQGTQIKDSFGGVGNAARAMGGYIMGLINPLTLTAAAVGVGAYAWYSWGRDAEEAANKAAAGLDQVKKKADEAQRQSKQQQLQQLTYQIQSAELDAQWQAGVAANTQKSNEIRAIAAKTAGEYRRLAAGLRQQKTDLEKQIEKEIRPKESKGDDRTQSEKDFADAWTETQRILQNTDPQAKANAEWERMIYLQDTLGEQFPLTAEQMGLAYEKAMGKEKAKESSSVWKTFAKDTQRALSDSINQGMTGEFGNIEQQFKQLLFRMAANAISADIAGAMFGQESNAVSGLLGGFSFSAPSFGGGKAVGGSVSANTIYEVNENGPELLNQDGKDYLMMGGKGGFVKPLGQGGIAQSGGSLSVVVHNYSGAPATARETVDSRGQRRLEVVVGEMVGAEMGRPGSAVHRSMRSNFGAQPAMVSR